MKITIVMGFFLPVPAVGGGAIEKIWFRLAQEFVAAGHEVSLVSREWPGFPKKETLQGVRMLRLPGFDHTRSLPRNLFLDGRWGLRVARAIPPGDLVVCNTVSLPVYLRWLKPSAGRVAAVFGRMPKGQSRFYGGVDRLLATSEAVAEKARRDNPRIADRVVLFPHPIDWELHSRAVARAAPSEPLTLGYVGRIHPEKGLELLLEAAVRLAGRPGLRPWRLVLIGPVTVKLGGGGESYRNALAARFGAALGDRLAFLPPEFDAGRLAARYGAMDIFCYPSRAETGEGLSIAPIEAMAAGAVPVVSGLECYRDIVADGRTGFVFDHRGSDPAAALAAILEKLVGDDALRRTVGAAAQERARFFDYASCSRFLLADFERLVSPPSGG